MPHKMGLNSIKCSNHTISLRWLLYFSNLNGFSATIVVNEQLDKAIGCLLETLTATEGKQIELKD